MSIWLTAKECVGLPDFPTRLQNIRSRLDKYSGKNENFRRRRVGTKAFEYHIDCLPEAAQEVVKQRHFNAVLEQKKRITRSKKRYQIPALNPLMN